MSKASTIEKTECLRLSNEASNKLTKECIQTALILLLEEKEFDQISVSEIAKKAGVSRTAYYRNYQSKEDILHQHLDQVVESIFITMKNKQFFEDDKEYWLSMFQNLLPYAHTAKILFLAHFDAAIENGIYKMLMREYPKATVAEAYIERFWSGAVCAVVKQWVLGGLKETPAQMAHLCMQAYTE